MTAKILRVQEEIMSIAETANKIRFKSGRGFYSSGFLIWRNLHKIIIDFVNDNNAMKSMVQRFIHILSYLNLINNQIFIF